jgi:ABC-2 type transport system permease protein
MPVFDQGYQHWSGKLSGHAWRWLTITRQGVRAGMKNPVLRIFVILTWVPAAGLAVMLCAWGLLERQSPFSASILSLLRGMFPPEMLANPKQYRLEYWTLCYDQFLAFELYLAMIVVLLVGPGLISLDLRFNALPLYFSRPMRRLDYFAGKLGVVAWFLSLSIFIPSLLAYLLGLLFSLDITIVRDTFPLLLAALAYGAVIVLSAGTFVLALSSLSRNSRYIALFWVAFWFVTMTVSGILTKVDREQRRSKMYRAQYATMAPAQQRVDGPPDRDEQMAQQRAWQEAHRKAQEEYRQESLRAARSNWRPLVSYTGNLSRIGDQLLDVNAAWRKLSELEPPDERDWFLERHLNPEYPWYWSAAVLAALFGLSACILNSRVRSLDRLR